MFAIQTPAAAAAVPAKAVIQSSLKSLFTNPKTASRPPAPVVRPKPISLPAQSKAKAVAADSDSDDDGADVRGIRSAKSSVPSTSTKPASLSSSTPSSGSRASLQPSPLSPATTPSAVELKKSSPEPEPEPLSPRRAASPELPLKKEQTDEETTGSKEAPSSPKAAKAKAKAKANSKRKRLRKITSDPDDDDERSNVAATISDEETAKTDDERDDDEEGKPKKKKRKRTGTAQPSVGRWLDLDAAGSGDEKDHIDDDGELSAQLDRCMSKVAIVKATIDDINAAIKTHRCDIALLRLRREDEEKDENKMRDGDELDELTRKIHEGTKAEIKQHERAIAKLNGTLEKAQERLKRREARMAECKTQLDGGAEDLDEYRQRYPEISPEEHKELTEIDANLKHLSRLDDGENRQIAGIGDMKHYKALHLDATRRVKESGHSEKLDAELRQIEAWIAKHQPLIDERRTLVKKYENRRMELIDKLERELVYGKGYTEEEKAKTDEASATREDLDIKKIIIRLRSLEPKIPRDERDNANLFQKLLSSITESVPAGVQKQTLNSGPGDGPTAASKEKSELVKETGDDGEGEEEATTEEPKPPASNIRTVNFQYRFGADCDVFVHWREDGNHTIAEFRGGKHTQVFSGSYQCLTKFETDGDYQKLMPICGAATAPESCQLGFLLLATEVLYRFLTVERERTIEDD